MTVYLALYKGRAAGRRPRDILARLQDCIIRAVTRSPYSHCELAVPLSDPQSKGQTLYRCYSSSPRDGGVRCKVMALPSEKWDLLPLPPEMAHIAPPHIAAYYQATAGAGYDWRGVVGTVLRCLGHSTDKWFCSEWCARVLGLPDAHRYTPQSLADRLTADGVPCCRPNAAQTDRKAV